MAITRRRAAFATNKVAQIVTLGLLYTLIWVTKCLRFLANGRFSQSGSHMGGVRPQPYEFRKMT